MEIILSALPSLMLAYLISRLEKVEAQVSDLKSIVLVIEAQLPRRKSDRIE